MDLISLKSFLKVAQLQSFSKAAAQLKVTQPAVSKRIANLEQSLQCSLFERFGRHIALTPAGEILQSNAERIIIDMENCLQAIKNLNHSIEGTLKLGLSHYIGLLRIPPILNLFAQRYPQVTLDIHFYDSESAQQDILQGAIDLAVVTLPRTIEQHGFEDLEQLGIWNDELLFATHNSHPLCQQPEVTLADLAAYPAILPGSDTFTGRLVQNAFDQAGIALKATHPTNNLENIKVMIATGFNPDCWSILPKLMFDQTTLRKHQLKELSLQRELGCLSNPKRTLSNAAEAFIQLLQQHA